MYDGEIPRDKRTCLDPSIMQKLQVPEFQAAAIYEFSAKCQSGILSNVILKQLGRNLLSGLFILRN